MNTSALSSVATEVCAYLVLNSAVMAACIGVLGALGVAGMTLWGVRITVKNSGENTTRQIDASANQAKLDREEAAKEAHKERIATARREVYLELVVKVEEAKAFIASLPQSDLDSHQLQRGVMPLIQAVSKLAVVSELHTAALARDLLSLLMKVHMRGLGLLQTVRVLKEELAASERYVEQADSEKDRLSREMDAPGKSNEAGPDRQRRLQTLFDTLHRGIAMHKEKMATANAKLVEINLGRMAGLVSDLVPGVDKLDELLSAMRTELGLASDLEGFRRQTAEMREQAVAAVAEFVIAVGEAKADR